MRFVLVGMLVVSLVAAGCVDPSGNAAGQDSSTGDPAVVDEVLDGDTVVLGDGERVRLMGLDATETGEPYAAEATERLTEMVAGENVTLVATQEDRDRYDRLLRYIYVNDTNANRVLVEDGLATAYYPSGTDQYTDAFMDVEQAARDADQYLWDRSRAADCISVTAFHWDAPGDDRYNMNGENVTFRNRCDSVNLAGWTVSDAGTMRYTFPDTVLFENDSVTLYSGAGTDTDTNRFWEASRPVWNNDGDRLFLRDADGELVEHVAYGQYVRAG